MIRDFPKWWAFLTYDEFKSHVNVTEGLEIFAEERIRVGKEEAGTSAFNQAYVAMTIIAQLEVFRCSPLGWKCSGCEWSSDIYGKGYKVPP